MRFSLFEMILFIFQIESSMSKSSTFDRKITGVIFNLHATSWSSDVQIRSNYTIENIRTMLEVVSTRFSRILIESVYAYNVPFLENVTYYHLADVRSRTAEIAAHMNREGNKPPIAVTIGIAIVRRDDQHLTTEINVALAASQAANSIFPGTVEGLVLYDHIYFDKLTSAKGILQLIKSLRKQAATLGLRIGMKHNCRRSFESAVLSEDSLELKHVKSEIIRHLDFIICSTGVHAPIGWHEGAIQGFNAIQSEVLVNRFQVKSFGTKIQVMWQTSWIPSILPRGNNTKSENDELRDYWVQVDKFATRHNYTVWLNGAWDNPKVNPALNLHMVDVPMGWWKLARNDLMNNISGYIELASGLPAGFDTDIGEDDFTNGTMSQIITEEEISQSTGKSLEMIIVVVFLSASLLAGAVYVAYKKWSDSRLSILTRQEIDEFRYGIFSEHNHHGDESMHSVTALKQPYDRIFEIPKERLQILTGKVLGGGEFGCVFKALLRDETDYETEVALKMTRPNGGALALKGLLSEIKILSYLGEHPNIVPMVGAYTAEIHKGTVYVATELCPLGSLQTYLKTFRDTTSPINESTVQFTDLLRWSYEIACGMAYLGEKGVVHADLATRNVLLSSENVAKITDFGLSRRLYEYTTYTKTKQEPLPWRWMAYESLKMMEFSEKSDVWSFGVTLWEIFSLGSQPYPGLSWSLDFVENLEDGLRLKQPRYATLEVYKIMDKCWILEKDARPSFTELMKATRCILTKSFDDVYTTLTVS